jgi:protein-tyrosine kinase
MDLLLDATLDTAATIIPTSVNGLSLLPAGSECSTATELLTSDRMKEVVAELLSRDPTRIVLFDSPPLLLTTESRALTAVAGQVVVVVRAEQTSHTAVLDALAAVGTEKKVGLVLNHCEMSANQFYYGYGEYGATAPADVEQK